MPMPETAVGNPLSAVRRRQSALGSRQSAVGSLRRPYLHATPDPKYEPLEEVVERGGRELGTLGTCLRKGAVMSVAKITEISATSTKSFDDAVAQGLARADKTLENISGAWVKEMKVDVKNGKITSYRVMMKVTFVLKD
jgi:flavin-binding protein dodecin